MMHRVGRGARLSCRIVKAAVLAMHRLAQLPWDLAVAAGLG